MVRTIRVAIAMISWILSSSQFSSLPSRHSTTPSQGIALIVMSYPGKRFSIHLIVATVGNVFSHKSKYSSSPIKQWTIPSHILSEKYVSSITYSSSIQQYIVYSLYTLCKISPKMFWNGTFLYAGLALIAKEAICRNTFFNSTWIWTRSTSLGCCVLTIYVFPVAKCWIHLCNIILWMRRTSCAIIAVPKTIIPA